MKLAIFPGSFDPFTLGHMDILNRACRLFDRVRVCVIENPLKNALFSVDERVAMIRLVIAQNNFLNADADSFAGLTADYARCAGASYIIRGLRNSADFEYEAGMEVYNKLLAPEVDTVYLNCGQKTAYISSSAVRELMRYGADIGTLVPDQINKYVSERLKNDG